MRCVKSWHSLGLISNIGIIKIRGVLVIYTMVGYVKVNYEHKQIRSLVSAL